MNMSIMNFWKKKFKEGEVKVEEGSSPVLKIFVGDKYVANLYHDGTDFCLSYREPFNDVQIPAFNPEDLGPNESPKINIIYRAKELWFVFAERLGALDRKDYVEEMKKYGLSKNSDPLLLLGKLGTVSISRPWRLELKKTT